MKSGNTDVYENEIPGTLKLHMEIVIMTMYYNRNCYYVVITWAMMS